MERLLLLCMVVHNFIHKNQIQLEVTKENRIWNTTKCRTEEAFLNKICSIFRSVEKAEDHNGTTFELLTFSPNTDPHKSLLSASYEIPYEAKENNSIYYGPTCSFLYIIHHRNNSHTSALFSFVTVKTNSKTVIFHRTLFSIHFLLCHYCSYKNRSKGEKDWYTLL
jgi:hypothetical protein